MTKYAIRPFQESDRLILRALTVAAFDGLSIEQAIDQAFGQVAERDWRWRKVRMAEANFAAPNAETAVVENESGDVVGYVSMRFDHDTSLGHIPDLVVDAAARNQGLGRRLMEHALQRFREMGMRVVRIETLDQNAVGRHLYPSLGFQEMARQIHYAKRLDDE